MFKNMKKTLIISVITLVFMYSIGVFAIPAPVNDYTCPIGNEKFRSINYLPQCPTNKFIIFKKDFTDEEIKKYEKIVNSEEYKSIPNDAPKEYYLAKLYEIEGNFTNKEKGMAYYNAYYSRYSNTEIRSEALKKGINYLEKAYLEENKSIVDEKIYLQAKKDDTVFWGLMNLYVENEDYDKVDNYIGKLDKKYYLEKIANFYYEMTNLDDSYVVDDYGYYGFINKITNPEVKNKTIQKGINYLNEVSKEKEKIGKKLSNTELIQLARLYREINDSASLDKLFDKMANDYSKEIVLFYLDEPEGWLGDVYTDKYMATNSDLEKALIYANKYIDLSSKSENNYGNVLSVLLKAEIERRLGRFEEANKTLNKANKNEVEKFRLKYQFDKLKDLINKKDNTVNIYIPLPVLY